MPMVVSLPLDIWMCDQPTVSIYGPLHNNISYFNTLIATVKPQNNGPSYSDWYTGR